MKTHIHTPGPFHITQNTIPGQFGTDTKIRSADNSVIAVLHVNVEGNGPLLAAAPDLLAALIEMLDASERPVNERWLSNVRSHAIAAIAKAEGNA